MNYRKFALTTLIWLLPVIAVTLAFAPWGDLEFSGIGTGLVELDQQWVTAFVTEAGLFGPLMLMAIMAAAILFSPLPSAPIAMAAGALYGHYEGTFYVFVGSLIGSSLAFWIARKLGYNAARCWLQQRFPHWETMNQTRLLLAIMVSRLIPFISFDLVSYAAGITPIVYWRFLLATAVGIFPASFALAHLGESAMDQSLLINALFVLVIALGMWLLGRKAWWATIKKQPRAELSSASGDSTGREPVGEKLKREARAEQ